MELCWNELTLNQLDALVVSDWESLLAHCLHSSSSSWSSNSSSSSSSSSSSNSSSSSQSSNSSSSSSFSSFSSFSSLSSLSDISSLSSFSSDSSESSSSSSSLDCGSFAGRYMFLSYRLVSSKVLKGEILHDIPEIYMRKLEEYKNQEEKSHPINYGGTYNGFKFKEKRVTIKDEFIVTSSLRLTSPDRYNDAVSALHLWYEDKLVDICLELNRLISLP